MRFKEAKRMIEGAGWKLDRVRGSHYIYTKNGVEFILPQHTRDIPTFIRRKINNILEDYYREVECAKKEAEVQHCNL